jgi:phosphoribosylanthranilate isomerase
MIWIKICGTTNLEDALAAVDAGAHAIGFVFAERSPRKIDMETAREIVAKLPEDVEKIGVFVSSDLLDPLEVTFRAGLTGLQSYPPVGGGAQGSLFKAVMVSSLPRRPRFLLALPMNLQAEKGENRDQIQGREADPAGWGKTLAEFASHSQGLLDTFVLDSGDLRQPGGTGKTFDWKKAVPIAEAMQQAGVKLVVAGGLNPENVGEAISFLNPWGVDVVSGVEERPGKKDPDKVRAFVKAVRDADKKKS